MFRFGIILSRKIYMTYLNITDEKENNNCLQYQDGLAVDFTIPKHICSYLHYGANVREVTILENAKIVQNHKEDKWRATAISLGPTKSLSEVATWEWLVSLGADINADNDSAVIWASISGHLEVVKYLVSIGADIHAHDDFAVRYASRLGHLEFVKYLVSVGANIHVFNDEAVRDASENGHLEVVKYLVSVGADIHADDDWAVRFASIYDHLEVVKYLVSVGADIHANDDYAVRLASENGHFEVVEYIKSLD